MIGAVNGSICFPKVLLLRLEICRHRLWTKLCHWEIFFAYGAIAQRQKFVISQVSRDLIFSFMFFKYEICWQCFV